MGGMRGRSGPPGNMNASRHHWRSFFARLALRQEDVWVRTEVQKYAAGLMSDKPDATEGERRAIEFAAEAKAARLLIWSAIAESGFTRRSREGLALVPAASELPKFIGVELDALKLLGLQRKAKTVLSLAEYLNGKPTAVEKTPKPAPAVDPVVDVKEEPSCDDH